MDWRDQGVLLTVRRHGENAAIIDVMTEHHGRHAGVVRGGAGRRMAPVLQPGAQIIVEWRARLEDHLGAYRVEPLRSRAAALMGDGDALAAMGAVAALLSAFLAEREPHDALYRATCSLLDMVGSDSNWPEAYIAWELALLSELGFPLDLSRCAVTQEREDLAFVSPRTGRAVSSHAGAAYADRLLSLPRFLGGIGRGEDIVDGLRLTGHFLTEWAGPAFARADATPARQRLVDRLCRREIGKSIGKVV